MLGSFPLSSGAGMRRVRAGRDRSGPAAIVAFIPTSHDGRVVASAGAALDVSDMSPRRWIEYGAWLTGIALLMLFAGARLWTEHERVRGLEIVRAAASSVDADMALIPNGRRKTAAAQAVHSATPSDRSSASVDQSLWSEKRAREYAEAVTRPGMPMGALLIPSIRLEVPIYSGTSELNLNRGAAHIEGTSPPGADGNVGIAAHRDGFFRGLESLHIDAEVILEVEARTVRYRVVEMRIVKPTDVHVLAPTDTPSVTLVTCYPFYFAGNAPERYVVRAELVDPADGLATTRHQVSVREPQTGGAEP